MKNKSSIHRLHRFPQIKGEGFFGFNLFNLCNLWIKKVFSLSGVASAMTVSVKNRGQRTEDSQLAASPVSNVKTLAFSSSGVAWAMKVCFPRFSVASSVFRLKSSTPVMTTVSRPFGLGRFHNLQYYEGSDSCSLSLQKTGLPA